MMFFHRHKGDLGEIWRGEPRALRFCGSDGKQEEESERAAHAKRKEKGYSGRGGAGRREGGRERGDAIFTLRFICGSHREN